MKSLAIVALLVCAAVIVSANTQLFPQRLRHGNAYREALLAERAHHKRLGYAPNTTENWFSPPIDHDHPSEGTFQDRFFYDTTYWDGIGPCMMYLNGEAPCASTPGGYMADIAKNQSACILTIEHRWYGKSLPGALTDKALFTKTLKIDQAMRDVHALIDYFETSVIGKSPSSWILVGGSYSGGMTVWLNEKYPGKFKASWAASGVVYATFSYVNYDGHVKSVVSQRCGEHLHYIMEMVGVKYDESAASRAKLQKLFNIPTYNTKQDIMWGMADVSASSVQYSRKTTMCSMMEPMPIGDAWAALQTYADYINSEWGSTWFQSCYYSTACLSNKSMSSGWASAGYSWIYQCCSEVAWWQIGYPGSIRSENLTTAYFMDQCRAAFYNNTLPDTWAFNTKHHGLHPVTKGYIIATQGSDDPWSTTGLSVSQGPTFPVTTAWCSNCGHCGSMMSPQSSDPINLQKQRELVMDSLYQWMKR